MNVGIGMNRIIAFTSLMVLLLLTACAPPPVLKNPSPVQYATTGAQPPVEQEYRIEVGDELDIKFFYDPELNERVIVRPDGRVSLQLVHEITAAGLTPAELTEFLARKYASELKKPEVTVIVRSFGAQKIYVDGEVAKPGMLPLLGLVTVTQAISQAGGVKESARTSEVIVIRHGAANKPFAFPVNLEKVIDGTDLRQDVPLKPFDIVFVPRSPIADVNVWVDQYIRKNIPVSLSLGYDFGAL